MNTPTDDMPQVFILRPYVEIMVSCLCGGMGVMPIAFMHHDPVTAFWVIGLMSPLCILFAWFARRTWSVVRVFEERVERKHARGEETLPRDQVRAVVITRAFKPWLPNELNLALEDGRSITVDRYFLFGRRNLRSARSLASRLGVTLRDPQGDALRESRFAPFRWRGRGDDWAYLGISVLVTGLVIGAIVLIALLAAGGQA